jgi:hypothetical protein
VGRYIELLKLRRAGNRGKVHGIEGRYRIEGRRIEGRPHKGHVKLLHVHSEE